jgi:hypothetical protein
MTSVGVFIITGGGLVVTGVGDVNVVMLATARGAENGLLDRHKYLFWSSRSATFASLPERKPHRYCHYCPKTTDTICRLLLICICTLDDPQSIIAVDQVMKNNPNACFKIVAPS